MFLLYRSCGTEVVPADPPSVAGQKALPEPARREHADSQATGIGGRVLTAVLALFVLVVLAFWLALAGIGSIVGNLAGLTPLVGTFAAAAVMLIARNRA
jgi:hypothetical protein